MTTEQVGHTCSVCGLPALVGLGGTRSIEGPDIEWLCDTHFSEALAKTRKLIEQALQMPRRTVAQ